MMKENRMKLILQGINPKEADIKQIAQQVNAGNLQQINAQVWRCDHVNDEPSVQDQAKTLALQANLDIAFMPDNAQFSDYKLVAMDMDSTLIQIECIDEIADMYGLKAEVAKITEASMRGELDFNASLTQRVGLLKGLDANALQKVYDERVTLSPGADIMLAAARAAGLKTMLVSGGFTFFTDRMKTRCQLDYSFANVLDIVDDKLTGKVVGDVFNAESKQEKVEMVCRELGCSTQQAITMGDGANDLKMMSVSGLSVAYHAKPKVRAAAKVAFNFVGLDGLVGLFA